MTLRAATVDVDVDVDVDVAVAVAVAVAFDVGPRLCTAVTTVPKSDKKAALSERSEFGGLPDFGAGGAGTPARAGAAQSGSPFLGYFFWRSKRSDPPAGADTRPASTTVQSRCVTGVGHTELSPCRQRSIDDPTSNATALFRCETTPVTQHGSPCSSARPGVRPGGRPTSFASP